MAKVRRLVGNDLSPKRNVSASASAGRQRRAMPSDSLVPIQFRMPSDFVRQFKQEALNRGLKLNDLFALCFNELRKS
jgi:hypothetical protein